jgi:predicted lipid-binding transport protein (Tim44 family)
MTEEQREVARREAIKEKMAAASVLADSYDPGRERATKQKQKEDEQRAKAEAAAAAEAAKKAKEAAELAKKQEIEDAKKKASKFLGWAVASCMCVCV